MLFKKSVAVPRIIFLSSSVRLALELSTGASTFSVSTVSFTTTSVTSSVAFSTTVVSFLKNLRGSFISSATSSIFTSSRISSASSSPVTVTSTLAGLAPRPKKPLEPSLRTLYSISLSSTPSFLTAASTASLIVLPVCSNLSCHIIFLP